MSEPAIIVVCWKCGDAIGNERGADGYSCPSCRPCGLCGGEIGPDITGRPMCYGCGPLDMMPREARDRRIADLSSRVDAARKRIGAEMLAAMFPVYEGPAEKPPAWHVRARWRLRGWWLGVREWIAVHVLRVDIERDDW